MQRSEKIAIAITLGLIGGFVIAFFFIKFNENRINKHAIEIQNAYDSGFIDGYNKGHENAVAETLEVIRNANNKNHNKN